ncbi:MAG: UPF0147 family protein [Candidatus Diapherotrites archaeon]|uniref:UPF0147 family protein n=1 Tax=Candidatus Iainarchaeum sp. TaxID=3101447 RepID=A0A7J4K376_9ARCH|nr:UPF0147 family protein [Candidatus Diapherotrites archaeon]HIH21936.1 hypothetical protein [Candidatus Diapherotrites archaeon]
MSAKAETKDITEDIKAVVELMDSVIADNSVPRNIRAAVDEARQKIESSEEKGVSITTAIYRLDDISNDINMPSHTRTEIWGIISELEALKEKLK